MTMTEMRDRLQQAVGRALAPNELTEILRMATRLAKTVEAYRSAYEQVLATVRESEDQAATAFAAANILAPLARRLDKEYRATAPTLLFVANLARRFDEFGVAATSVSDSLQRKYSGGVHLAKFIRDSRK